MRPLPGLLCAAALAVAACAERGPAPHPEAPAPLPWPATVADLAWLAGDWVGDAGGSCFIERWLPPASGSLVGIGRHESGGIAARVTRETMRVFDPGDGLVMMVMLESGQVTRFPVAAVGDQGFLARRADAGWPASIRYTRHTNGQLTVTLAGGPAERALEIRFSRVPPSTEPHCLGRVSL